MDNTNAKINFIGSLNVVDVSSDIAIKKITDLWDFQECRFTDEDIKQINQICREINVKVAGIRKITNDKFARITKSYIDGV